MKVRLVIEDDAMFSKIEYGATVEIEGNKNKVDFIRALIEKAVEERNAQPGNGYDRWTLK